MEVKGKLKSILETQEFKNDFKKRSVILVTNDKYPQTLQIDFTNKNIELLKPFQIEEDVTIGINLRGTVSDKDPNNIRYFTNINGWRIDKLEAEVTNGQQNEARNDNDDFPF